MKLAILFVAGAILFSATAGRGIVLALTAAPPALANAVAASLPRCNAYASQLALLHLDIRRHKLEALLLALARSGRPEVRAAAMYLLGAYRMAGAAPFLVHNVDFVYQGGIIKGLPLVEVGARPGVAALVRIGMPGVRAILKVLPGVASPNRRRLMVLVMDGVEGRAVARFRLGRSLARATTAAQRANLTAALADIPPPVARHKVGSAARGSKTEKKRP